MHGKHNCLMIFHFLIRGTFPIILGACIIIFGVLVAIIGAGDLILGPRYSVLSTLYPECKPLHSLLPPLYSICLLLYSVLRSIKFQRCSFLYIRWLVFHAQCFFRSQFTPDSVQFSIWFGVNSLLRNEAYNEKSSANGLDN